MFSFFDSILGFLGPIWDIIYNFFSSLLYALVILRNAMVLPVQLYGFVPTVLGAAISIFLGVYVVKFLIGR